MFSNVVVISKDHVPDSKFWAEDLDYTCNPL